MLIGVSSLGMLEVDHGDVRRCSLRYDVCLSGKRLILWRLGVFPQADRVRWMLQVARGAKIVGQVDGGTRGKRRGDDCPKWVRKE